MNTLNALILKNWRAVYLPSSLPAGGKRDLNALENDLLEMGFVLDLRLHQRLSELADPDFVRVSSQVLDTLKRELGAHRSHVPLFINFPRSTPRNTHELWITRMVSYLLQQPHQPCVLCGKDDTVHALNPCGHLVCSSCWDMQEYSGCPICHGRIEQSQPFCSFRTMQNPVTCSPPV